jgi:hypothetical protein
LTYQVSYTYSKLMDDGSDYRFILTNAFDAHHLWAPSSLDRTHVFIASLVYDLHFFRNSSRWIKKPLSGWRISAVSQFQTGTPFSIATTEDIAGVGSGGNQQYAVVHGNPELPRSSRRFSNSISDANYWFAVRNPDGTPIFTNPAAGTFNTQSVRNIIYGPGFQSHNLAMSKSFTLGEMRKIEFRGEAFDWPNHPNLKTPSTDFLTPGGSTFGKVTSKQDQRQVQFMLRYTF